MSEVIRVDNISKQYRLGSIGTGSITHDLNRWYHKVRGKEDPYLTIGEENDRSLKGMSDYVWSLRDINFGIKEGDVVGIIGKNGAGKSTLLKILSRTTSPTTGTIKIRGRVASLLEVGTGFHPELSGRENIFLNGAILGMTKKEIVKKFDEIVDFSGVERYIDTPVKRYSSGMYVRLAFAVAAHLESEILIVDEVLAVGDSEFQKKCLGKMNDVSKGQGRTVLFVSHNMGAVKSLCRSGILLDKGKVLMEGEINSVVNEYLTSQIASTDSKKTWDEDHCPSNGQFKVHSIGLTDRNCQVLINITTDDEFYITVEFEVIEENIKAGMTVIICDTEENILLSSINNHEANYYNQPMQKGRYISMCKFEGNFFNNGLFVVSLIMFGANFTESKEISKVITFEIYDGINVRGDFHGSYIGYMRPKLNWETKNLISI